MKIIITCLCFLLSNIVNYYSQSKKYSNLFHVSDRVEISLFYVKIYYSQKLIRNHHIHAQTSSLQPILFTIHYYYDIKRLNYNYLHSCHKQNMLQQQQLYQILVQPTNTKLDSLLINLYFLTLSMASLSSGVT